MRFHLGENSRMALANLRDHKVRSFLTVLGVVIGISAVIAVASILVGLNRDVEAQLKDFGANTLFIFKFDPGIHVGRLSTEERTRKPLTLDDGLALKELCPAVREVNVQLFPGVGQGPQIPPEARYKDRESDARYFGTLPTYEEVEAVRVAKGRFFTDAEDLHRAEVVVIGYDLDRALFPSEDAIGKSIVIGGQPYQVVGVLEKRKGSFLRAEGSDTQALVPYRTYHKHNPVYNENFIEAQAYPERQAEAEDQVRAVLRLRRKVPFDKPDNFGISSAEQIAEQFRQITAGVALLTIAISSIGLLVGGVGVMNIMLMSVTERTREIGVRKAIGARRRDIIFQFLTEAMTLTGGGGVIGVLLGISISLLIHLLAPGLPSVVPAWAIVAGVAVSMSVGLFFGIYPAVKAARLDPVEALRYE